MEDNKINLIIDKANAMLQALENIEVKGRANINNLSYSMSLLEELVKISVDEINKLKVQVDELTPSEREKTE